MIRLLVAVAAVVAVASPAAADGPPPPLPPPAVRLDLARLLAEQTAIGDAVTIERGTPGDCESYKSLAIDAGWTEAQWPVLRTIIRRESRCRPDVVNRYGCIGLVQACRINHRRLGVTAEQLKDPAVNLAVGHTLCQEWLDVGRSCFKPWWTRRWKP